MKPDIWDVFALLGTALIAGGIGAQWGVTWACMFLGALLLFMAGLHAWRSGAVKGEE